jgi:hypothetical protein
MADNEKAGAPIVKASELKAKAPAPAPATEITEVESIGDLAVVTSNKAVFVANSVKLFASENRPAMFVLRSVLTLVGGSALIVTLWETAWDPRFIIGLTLLSLSYGVYRLSKPNS